MKTKEMDKLTSHFDLFFGQNDCTVLHPIAQEPHIDVLLITFPLRTQPQ